MIGVDGRVLEGVPQYERLIRLSPRLRRSAKPTALERKLSVGNPGHQTSGWVDERRGSQDRSSRVTAIGSAQSVRANAQMSTAAPYAGRTGVAPSLILYRRYLSGSGTKGKLSGWIGRRQDRSMSHSGLPSLIPATLRVGGQRGKYLPPARCSPRSKLLSIGSSPQRAKDRIGDVGRRCRFSVGWVGVPKRNRG